MALSSSLCSSLLFSLLISSFSPSYAQQRTGDITAYGDGWQGGACLYQDLPEPAKKSFVAINQVLWDSMGMQQVCGRCVKISYGGKTVMGMVTNRCPECKEGDLDLSDSLFKEATGSHPSRLTASWELVDCEDSMGVTGDVGFYVKDGVNANWLALQPVNFRSPITKLSLEYPAGKTVELPFAGGALNYYLASGLNINGQFTVRAEDAEGKSYEVSADSIRSSSFLTGASPFQAQAEGTPAGNLRGL